LKIYTHEFNIALENTAWLPLSTGCLQAYALTHEAIRDNYEFMPFRFVKKPLSEIEPYHNPGVAAFSCSMWNVRMNLAVARKIKEQYPSCLVVFGGASVPPDPKFLNKYPFIDVAVNGEGEQIFTDILLRYLESTDFSEIPSISWRSGDQVIRNPGEPPFTKDLDLYPIPYTSGVFDYLLDDSEYKFQAIVETNRGCPFKCSFCFWGEGTMDMGKKYRFFGMDNIKELADWVGERDIQYIFCADSNFGCFPRDKEIAEYFVSAKQKYGTPEKFRVCYAKNAGDRVFEVAETFHKANMEKALTLARQSNDETTLINVDRGNIKLSVFNTLAKKAANANIPIYSELILAMPGETYDTFVNGVEDLLQQSVNAQIFIYLCSILTNTTMDLPSYREQHGIITKRIPLTEQHYKIHGVDDIEEIDEVVIGTNTMPVEDWEKSLMYSWFFQLLYSLRVGIFPLLYLQFKHGLKITKFVEYFIANAKGKISTEVLSLFQDTIDSILNEGPSNVTFEGSPIYWPVEEMAYLVIAEDKHDFYNEIERVMVQYLHDHDIEPSLDEIADVMRYQACRLISREQKSEVVELSYNVPKFFEDVCKYVDDTELKPFSCKVHTAQVSYADRHEFALKVLVYGRKSDGMLGNLHPSRDLTEFTVTK